MSNYDSRQAILAKTVNSVECRRLIDGRFTKYEAKVVIEKELPIFINGEHLVTASITPAMEKEFITGYLFGQVLIDKTEELESIDLEGDTARVTVKDARKILQRTKQTEYRIVSGGGQAVFFNEMSFPHIHTRMKISKKEIRGSVNGGGANVKLTAFSGGIYIKKR